MENNVSIYGEHKPELEKLLNSILLQVSEIREEMKSQLGIDPVEHCLGRIKSEDSMREKCVRKNLPVTTESALEKIYDAVGVRIVCAFVDDVFTIRDYIVNSGRYEVINEKDYINTAKPNGYRSYHMILRVGGKYHAEIQLRTISMDTWAALEHHLKYKKKIGARQKLIEEELKRCADELASTDLSMQTIRDMILEGDN
ncbi:GTP pyrophosphokinase family protein [Ruminococcus sp. JL13D9]|uniref:GTP pyrophosphokinase n=1 Tax=Ruminococcus sp. JL13D9 TaxID=3233381 RepID=UPI003899E862